MPERHSRKAHVYKHSACRHVRTSYLKLIYITFLCAAMPSFSPLRLSSASWPTTSLSAKCQRAAIACHPHTINHVNFWRYWASKHGIQISSRVAARLLYMHLTACACERNWSAWGQMYTKLRFKMAVERARKLIYVHGNGKESGKEDMDLCLNLLEEEA